MFSAYPVSPQKIEALRLKMERWGIRDADIEEKFIRSSGHGGQNVNKVSTCVVVKHIPTGIEVRCQKERSQALNRYLAMRLLVEKIEEKNLGAQSAKQQAIEKIRRQKRRRSRKAKIKMLEGKSKRSEVKRMRSSPRMDE